MLNFCFFFFFQAEDGIRDFHVTGVQTCALPISLLACPISRRPTYAVRPGMPSTPSAVEIGARFESSFRKPTAGDEAYCCQPSMPVTKSPAENFASRDS